MRRKIIVVLTCLVMFFSFVSCGSTNENTNDENNKAFMVDKILYECDKFELSCEKISSEGVEFNCKNKTNEEIKMHLTVALDGTVASLWSESNETTIAPKKSQAFYMHGSLEITEHKFMSINGTAFIDSGNISFDICDFNLGGKENKDDLSKGESYYSTNDLVVEYIGADAQGLEFKVVNNRDKSITFGADTLKINGESKDYAMTVTTIPAHSQGIYSIDILSYNEDYFSNQLTSFEGVLEARIDGKGKVDRFPISYNKDESTTIEETTTKPTITDLTTTKSVTTQKSDGVINLTSYTYEEFAMYKTMLKGYVEVLDSLKNPKSADFLGISYDPDNDLVYFYVIAENSFGGNAKCYISYSGRYNNLNEGSSIQYYYESTEIKKSINDIYVFIEAVENSDDAIVSQYELEADKYKESKRKDIS